MPGDLNEIEKPIASGNVILFERITELTKYQSALSRYLQLLRAAKTAKV